MRCDYRQGRVTNGFLSARDHNDQRQAGAGLRAAHKQGEAGGVRVRSTKPVSKKDLNCEAGIKAAIFVLRKQIKSKS